MSGMAGNDSQRLASFVEGPAPMLDVTHGNIPRGTLGVLTRDVTGVRHAATPYVVVVLVHGRICEPVQLNAESPTDRRSMSVPGDSIINAGKPRYPRTALKPDPRADGDPAQ
jgi:hypothetical protein